MNNKKIFKSTKYLIPDTLQNICLNPKKSQGSFLYDDFSHRHILDLHGFFSTLPLGYNHSIFKNKKFIKTVNEYAGLKPSAGRIMTKFLDEFILNFHEFVNAKIFNKYFFIHGGGLAVENSLKIAFDWKHDLNTNKGIKIKTNDLEIISFKNAFHGVTGYTLNLSDNPTKVNNLPLFKWAKFEANIMNFDSNICTSCFCEKSKNKRNTNIENLENYILKKSSSKIAAVIIETVQGGGGDKHMCDNFLISLANLLKKHNILLLIDEVQTGFGVTGKLWSFQHSKIIPDILIFGKKSQISGICINKKIPNIANVINKPGRYPPTWNGDIIDYIRCNYIIQAYKDFNLIDNANKMGAYIVNNLRKMKKFNNVRGKGFLIAFDFENQIIRDSFFEKSFKKGLLMQSMQDNTIRIRPNMAIKKNEVDTALDIITNIN